MDVLNYYITVYNDVTLPGGLLYRDQTLIQVFPQNDSRCR